MTKSLNQNKTTKTKTKTTKTKTTKTKQNQTKAIQNNTNKQTNNRPILVGAMVQNNQELVFYAVLGHLGTPKWTQKVHKGPQVDGMYGQMS
jgi:hypothetical protein